MAIAIERSCGSAGMASSSGRSRRQSWNGNASVGRWGPNNRPLLQHNFTFMRLAFDLDFKDLYERDGLIRMDISAYLDHKMAALAAHRTQFAIEPEMLSLAQVWQLLGQEYFEPASLATSTGIQYANDYAGRADDTLQLDAQPFLAQDLTMLSVRGN